jgi:hypothetical protein
MTATEQATLVIPDAHIVATDVWNATRRAAVRAEGRGVA